MRSNSFDWLYSSISGLFRIVFSFVLRGLWLAMIIITSGVGGSGLMMKPFSLALQTWGFNVIDSIDIIKNGDPTSTLTTPPEKVNQKRLPIGLV